MDSFDSKWPTRMDGTLNVVAQRCKFLCRRVENSLWNRSTVLQDILEKENELLLKQGITKMKIDMCIGALDNRMVYGELSNDPDTIKEWIVLPPAEEEKELKRVLREKIIKLFVDQMVIMDLNMKHVVGRMTTSIQTKVLQNIVSYRNRVQEKVENIIKTETDKSSEQLRNERRAIYNHEMTKQCKETETLATENVAREKIRLQQRMIDAREKKIWETMQKEGKDLERTMKEKVFVFINKKEKELTEIKKEMIQKYTESKLMEIRREAEDKLRKKIDNEMTEFEREMKHTKTKIIKQAIERELIVLEDYMKTRRQKLMKNEMG